MSLYPMRTPCCYRVGGKGGLSCDPRAARAAVLTPSDPPGKQRTFNEVHGRCACALNLISSSDVCKEHEGRVLFSTS